MAKKPLRAQGAFEYMALLAGIVLVVVVANIVLKNALLAPSTQNLEAGTSKLKANADVNCLNYCGEGAWEWIKKENASVQLRYSPACSLSEGLNGNPDCFWNGSETQNCNSTWSTNSAQYSNKPPRNTRFCALPKPGQQTTQPTATPTPTPHYVTGCGSLNEAGYYLLENDVTTSSDCFKVNATNVHFNCNGKKIASTTYYPYSAFTTDANDVEGFELENCVIENFGYAYNHYNPNGKTRNSNFHDNLFHHNYNGVYTYNIENTVIQKNNFSGGQTYSLLAISANGLSIKYNNVSFDAQTSTCTGYPVYLRTANNTAIENNYFNCSSPSHAGNYGVILDYEGENASIKNNVVDYFYNGMQIDVKNAAVENNYVHHAINQGILITGANVTLQSNDASGSQYYCYAINYNAENVTLNGNTARDCSTGVFVSGGAANITITSNSFQNTSYRGIYLYDYVGGQVKMTNNNLCASNASDYDVSLYAQPSSIIVSGNSCHQNKCYNNFYLNETLKSFCLPEGSVEGNCSTIC